VLGLVGKWQGVLWKQMLLAAVALVAAMTHLILSNIKV